MNCHNHKIVYYGPHPCQTCDKNGKKGTMIVKAGNGAPENLEFEFPNEAKKLMPTGFGGPYPNTHTALPWKKHIHIK